ncbi:TPA: hypothetical protein HA238_05580 [Candidatus Micrarchaeota archaeon]|nr:hypothetical protein [Candidatus Micrarchaeota archaeon]
MQIGYKPPKTFKALSEEDVAILNCHFPQSHSEHVNFKENLPGRLAVITSFFNPMRYRRLHDNYMRFKEELLKHNADLWTIELAFGKEPFALPENPKTLRIRTHDIIWQKEPALNILINSLPSHYDKIAWADADLIFENYKWQVETSQILEELPVVQCFEFVERCRIDESIENKKISVAKAIKNNSPTAQDFRFSHAGCAWAARRTLLKAHNLYCGHILGGNDALWTIACFGWKIWYHLRLFNKTTLEHYLKWADGLFRSVNGKVGLIEGNIRHLWHGNIKDRQYIERYGYLIDNNFNPNKDVYLGDNGLLHWTGNNIQLISAAKDYFSRRKDDG